VSAHDPTRIRAFANRSGDRDASRSRRFPGPGPHPAATFLYASPSFKVGRSGRPLYL
jgi:hypothetical protein